MKTFYLSSNLVSEKRNYSPSNQIIEVTDNLKTEITQIWNRHCSPPMVQKLS